ncbi:MAG TPA: transcriptional regulator [Chthonomonadaceae bacterium]|nr:transcriptional regulator [Chthonomonadaceae bacterium]
MKPFEQFGQWVHWMRERRGWSGEALAKLLGCTATYVYTQEAGKSPSASQGFRKPRKQTMQQWVEVFVPSNIEWEMAPAYLRKEVTPPAWNNEVESADQKGEVMDRERQILLRLLDSKREDALREAKFYENIIAELRKAG